MVPYMNTVTYKRIYRARLTILMKNALSHRVTGVSGYTITPVGMQRAKCEAERYVDAMSIMY